METVFGYVLGLAVMLGLVYWLGYHFSVGWLIGAVLALCIYAIIVPSFQRWLERRRE